MMAAALQLTFRQVLPAGRVRLCGKSNDAVATSALAAPGLALSSSQTQFRAPRRLQCQVWPPSRRLPGCSFGQWNSTRWQHQVACKASENGNTTDEGSESPLKKRTTRRAGRKPKTVGSDEERFGAGTTSGESEGDETAEGTRPRRGRGGRRRASGATSSRSESESESGSESDVEIRRSTRTAVENRERGLLTGQESEQNEVAEREGKAGGMRAQGRKGELIRQAYRGCLSTEKDKRAEGDEMAEEDETAWEAGEWGEEGKYGWPPLIVCMGEALSEFVPAVRVNNDEIRQDDPEIISSWKAIQWSPPEFARTPGGPTSNVAIALGRLNARVGFMGRLGDDPEGRHLADLMWSNGVMVDGVTFDPEHRTMVSQMALKVEEGGKMELSCEVPSADSVLSDDDVDQELLEEARILHVTAMSLLTEPSRSTVIANARRARQRGTRIVLDVNLPLYLWSSQTRALETLSPIWLLADVIKVSCVEIEFLINEAYFERRRVGAKQYAAENEQVARALGNPFHYEMREVLPVLPDNVKLLLVTNGTWSVHYYTPEFNGYVVGAEDVLVSAYHCDRTGSGDAIMAAFLRKLSLYPEILHNEDRLRRAIRFAISAGIVTQWTRGAVRSLPTESAVQCMTEQVYNIANVYM